MPQLPLDTASHIQALLFAEGGPLTLKKLASMLACDAAALAQGLDTLDQKLSDTGITLVRTETEVALAVSLKSRSIVADVLAKEQDRDIGDAGLEILGVLLYEGPSTRATIDYIRGVNSSSTLRTLLSRGLVERTGNPEDGREYLYRPTVELMAHLGVGKGQELPDYATIASELTTFKKNNQVFEEPETAEGSPEI